MRMAFLGLLLGASMCKQGPGSAKDTDVETPTQVTQTKNGLDCKEVFAVPDPGLGGLPECIVEELTCGSVVSGTNEGGSTWYDRQYWEDAQSLDSLAFEDEGILDGPERVYAFYGHLPDEDIRVTVTSCVQLWSSYIRHGDVSVNWCDEPSPVGVAGHFTGQWPVKDALLLNRSGAEYDWELIIDSWDGQVGNYRIEVECL